MSDDRTASEKMDEMLALARGLVTSHDHSAARIDELISDVRSVTATADAMINEVKRLAVRVTNLEAAQAFSGGGPGLVSGYALPPMRRPSESYTQEVAETVGKSIAPPLLKAVEAVDAIASRVDKLDRNTSVGQKIASTAMFTSAAILVIALAVALASITGGHH